MSNKKLIVEIQTGNAAFELDEKAELSRILRELADKVEQGFEEINLRDFNGNKVGFAELLSK
ncbi:hypothetical protein [Thiomicrorhabdus indica]|uniref:hypothetical protein n=1 Tax=Thiomicrorhabdus indica TaxID=2267253 RepID=UPI00102D8881|nr:hypothetical protein [Thiomicrorhabdus indica]